MVGKKFTQTLEELRSRRVWTCGIGANTQLGDQRQEFVARAHIRIGGPRTITKQTWTAGRNLGGK